MYKSISEASNFCEDTALEEECYKSSPKCQCAKMLKDYSYRLQILQPIIEHLDILSSKLDSDFTLSYEKTYVHQIYKSTINYHQWLCRYYNYHSKLLSSNKVFQELNKSRNSDNVYQYPDFSEKSDTHYRYPDMYEIREKQDESIRSPAEKKSLENKKYFTHEISSQKKVGQANTFQKNYPEFNYQHINTADRSQFPDFIKRPQCERKNCCRTDDIKVLDDNKYSIRMDDYRLPNEKKISNSSQVSNCAIEKENHDLNGTDYMERVKVHTFTTEKKHVCNIENQKKRNIPRILTKDKYSEGVSSKQWKNIKIVNGGFYGCINNYEDIEHEEKHILNNPSKTPYQKKNRSFRWPERLTDNSENDYRYPDITEILDEHIGSDKLLEQDTYSEIEEYFKRTIGNMISLILTRTKDKKKQENEGFFSKTHLEKISSENLNLYPHKEEGSSGFNPNPPLDRKTLADSQVYSEISRKSTNEMRDSFGNTHHENTMLDRYCNSSIDRKCASENKSEKLCTTDCDRQQPCGLNNQPQPPLKVLLNPSSGCEITFRRCSDHSCKFKESVLGLVLKSQCQANCSGTNYQEDTATKSSSKILMNDNPETRDLCQNSQHYETLEPPNWQEKHQNIAENSDPKYSGLRVSESKQNIFSVRDPNDFITAEEAEKILGSMKLQSENSVGNLKESDYSNTTKTENEYEDIDVEPNDKIDSISNLHESVLSGTSDLGKYRRRILKGIFRKLKNKTIPTKKRHSFHL